MMALRRIALVGVVLTGACEFSHGTYQTVTTVDGSPVMPPDGGQCLMASLECATADVLRSCAGENAP